MPRRPMVHVTDASSPFHARVLVARLGAEGVLAEARGVFDGPYPFGGCGEIWVPDDEAELAREVLIGDAVEAALLPQMRRSSRRARTRQAELFGACTLGLALVLLLLAIL